MLQSLELWQQDCYELPFINDGHVHHLRLHDNDVLVFQCKNQSRSVREALAEQLRAWAAKNLPVAIHLVMLPEDIDLRCVMQTEQAQGLFGVEGEIGKVNATE